MKLKAIKVNTTWSQRRVIGREIAGAGTMEYGDAVIAAKALSLKPVPDREIVIRK